MKETLDRLAKLVGPIASIALVAIALIIYSRGKAKQQELTERLSYSEKTGAERAKAFETVYREELRLVGRTLQEAPLTALTGDAARSLELHGAGRRLLLLLSDIDCDVCQDRETQFAKSIADTLGPRRTAVIVSGDRRFATAYVRVNGARFPVFLDEPDAFGKGNSLPRRPLLLVLEGGRVTMAHMPQTSLPSLSEAFHEVARRYLASER